MIGPTFVEVTADEATEFIEKSKERLDGRLTEAKGKMDALMKEQDKLKSVLYQKFGKTINLED